MLIHVEDADEKHFRAYGSLVVMPDSPAPLGSDTVRFWPALANYSICGGTELGLCTCLERPRRIDRLERHLNTPEVLIPIDGDFLLPIASADQPVASNGALEPEKTEVIRVKAGCAVIIDPGVWHWAVWPASGESVTYLVLFASGTSKEDLEIRDMEDEIRFQCH
ncbi:MAG: ureidoglycolate lyase [Armatimonadetes bacterium]|nr:ureidoglycolate lyase [Armatimonadota bacterium]